MTVKAFGLALVLTAGLMSSADAQQRSSATVYSNGNFKGYSRTFDTPVQGLDPAFTAKSIRIPEGEAWEFCNGKTFSGCKRLDSSMKAGVVSIRSARPIAPVVRSAPGAVVPNGSLRGLTSEFFTAPRQGDARVGIAKNNPEDMRRSATEFCRRAGWRGAAYSQLQEVGGSYFLIDVLCSNDG